VTSLPQLIRILIVDDHVVVRTGLRMLIETRSEMRVVGEAGNRADACEIAARELPDIILLDLNLGLENGLDFLPDLLAAAALARVLILTGFADPELHRRAVCLGAMGIVLKQKAASVLLEAIEKVNAGEVWLDRLMASILMTDMRQGQSRKKDPEEAKIASLTPREREVIKLVCTGMKNKQIGEQLSISEATVRNHLTSVLSKLRLSDRFELSLYAFHHGLADPPVKIQ
jgi:two-component system nitrate/nitrite response regulator NarL